MIHAALFDMDGVLVFSEEAWFLVYNRTLARFGHPPISRAAFDAIYGNGTEADRDTYMPERSIEEVNAAYEEYFQEYLGEIQTNPEAIPVLEELRNLGIRTAAATNTQKSLACRILSLTGILPHLDAVASADEAGAGKPDPAVLYLASEKLRVPLSDCLFTGDSRYDLEAARQTAVRFLPFRMGTQGSIQSLFEFLERVREDLL